MKKILLLSTIFFGFGLINAGLNEDEIREKLVKLDEEKIELTNRLSQAVNNYVELEQYIASAVFDRCECAILKGISEPEAGIECEKEVRKMLNSYAKLSESNTLLAEGGVGLLDVMRQQVVLKAQLQKIEKK